MHIYGKELKLRHKYKIVVKLVKNRIRPHLAAIYET